MVKVTNGVNVFTVSNGAFDSIYSKQGYVLVDEIMNEQAPFVLPDVLENQMVETNGVDDMEEEAEHEEPEQEPQISREEQFLKKIVERPISQWSKIELKQYSDLNGIDLTSAKTTAQVKALVKDFMEK